MEYCTEATESWAGPENEVNNCMVEARSRQVYMRPMSAKLYKKKHVEWGEGGHYSPVTDQYPVIDVPVEGHYSLRGDIIHR